MGYIVELFVLNQISNIGVDSVAKAFQHNVHNFSPVIRFIPCALYSFAFMMGLSRNPKSNNYKIFCTKIKIL